MAMFHAVENIHVQHDSIYFDSLVLLNCVCDSSTIIVVAKFCNTEGFVCPFWPSYLNEKQWKRASAILTIKHCISTRLIHLYNSCKNLKRIFLIQSLLQIQSCTKKSKSIDRNNWKCFKKRKRKILNRLWTKLWNKMKNELIKSCK